MTMRAWRIEQDKEVTRAVISDILLYALLSCLSRTTAFRLSFKITFIFFDAQVLTYVLYMYCTYIVNGRDKDEY
jgi:hypothetical protein